MVVLVTGAASGIGQAVANALISAGVRVVGTFNRTAPSDRRISWVELDLTKSTCAELLHQHLRDAQVTHLSGVVHCAGICEPGALEWMDPDAVLRSFQVNAWAPIAITSKLLRLLPSGATVIYLGSSSGRVALPLLGAYSASKFGLRALATAQHTELAPLGVRTVYVECGNVDTRIWAIGHEMLMRRFEAAGAQGHLAAAVRAAARLGIRSQRLGMKPDRVATRIAALLFRRRPPRLVRLGLDAWFWAFFELFLSERTQARIAARLFSLHGKRLSNPTEEASNVVEG
jgi:NAD(P)-dependent dehydrogenase (short-subunit alcohol dehydrogenase family)